MATGMNHIQGLFATIRQHHNIFVDAGGHACTNMDLAVQRGVIRGGGLCKLRRHKGIVVQSVCRMTEHRDQISPGVGSCCAQRWVAL